MCNCYGEVKEKLQAHFQDSAPPGASKVEITLEGYLFGLGGPGISHCSSNNVRVQYQVPKKDGGVRNVSKKTYVRATFCPFCGEKYFKEELAQ